jgi:GAF domain-containing protein
MSTNPPESTRHEEAERALVASERRLAAQGAALTQLMARYADSPGSLDEQIRGILATTAHTLGADRLSMWHIDRQRDQIVCADLYERAADRHEPGLLLSRVSAPRYFDALDTERVIAAHDARTDARTNEFEAPTCAERHLVDARRAAAPQWRDRGGLCAESTSLRTWTLDEQHFAIAIAHLIGAALADEERRAAVARLADSESRARLLIDTAHDAFIGIDSSGAIITWNTRRSGHSAGRVTKRWGAIWSTPSFRPPSATRTSAAWNGSTRPARLRS